MTDHVTAPTIAVTAGDETELDSLAIGEGRAALASSRSSEALVASATTCKLLYGNADRVALSMDETGKIFSARRGLNPRRPPAKEKISSFMMSGVETDEVVRTEDGEDIASEVDEEEEEEEEDEMEEEVEAEEAAACCASLTALTASDDASLLVLGKEPTGARRWEGQPQYREGTTTSALVPRRSAAAKEFTNS